WASRDGVVCRGESSLVAHLDFRPCRWLEEDHGVRVVGPTDHCRGVYTDHRRPLLSAGSCKVTVSMLRCSGRAQEPPTNPVVADVCQMPPGPCATLLSTWTATQRGTLRLQVQRELGMELVQLLLGCRKRTRAVWGQLNPE